MKIKKEDFLVQVKYSDLLPDPRNIGIYFLGFGAELYLRAEEITNYDPRIIETIKSFSIQNHLPLSLHAPIATLDYSKIKDVVFYMQPLYKKVIELALALGIDSIVAHAELDYETNFSIDRKLESATRLWGMLCRKCAASKIHLNIENHREVKPDHLVELMKRIGSSYLGMCIDIGHCNAYGNLEIEEWLEQYPVGSIKEIHLADNKGDDDTHLPLGWGNVDLTTFFDNFAERGEKARFVLEPRDIKEAQESIAFLKERGFLVA